MAQVEYLPDAEERELLLQELAGLIGQVGWERFVRTPIVLPSAEYFPDRWTPDADGVHRLAMRFLRYAGLDDLELDIEIFEGERAPEAGVVRSRQHSDAAAWFAGIEDGVCYFGANANQLEDPLGVTAAMGHETAHAFRHRHQIFVDDLDTEERLTDLTTVYLGFGVLTTNASQRHRSFGSAEGLLGSHGWSVSSLGYLSPQALSYLLAAMAIVRGYSRRELGAMASQLETNQATYFERAAQWLQKERPGLVEELGVRPQAQWPPVPDLASYTGPLKDPDDEGESAAEEDAGEAPATKWNAGNPVLRVPRGGAASLGVPALGIAVVLTLFGVAISPWLALVVPVVSLLGYKFLGPKFRDYECSACTYTLRRGVRVCPHCGGNVTKTVSKPEDRFDEDEPEAVGAGESGPPVLAVERVDGSGVPQVEGIMVVSEEGSLAKRGAVSNLETRLGLSMPPGYAEYMEALGGGLDTGRVQILGPQEVLEQKNGLTAKLREKAWKGDLFEVEVDAVVPFAFVDDDDLLAAYRHQPGIYLFLRESGRVVRQADDLGKVLTDILETDDDHRRWFAPDSVELRATLEGPRDYEPFTVLGVLEEYGDMYVEADADEDETHLLILVPGIGGYLYVDSEGTTQVEVYADAAHVGDVRRLTGLLAATGLA